MRPNRISLAIALTIGSLVPLTGCSAEPEEPVETAEEPRGPSINDQMNAQSAIRDVEGVRSSTFDPSAGRWTIGVGTDGMSAEEYVETICGVLAGDGAVGENTVVEIRDYVQSSTITEAPCPAPGG